MKNVVKICALAFTGLLIQCKEAPKPPQDVEDTVKKQVLFASDLFLFELDQKEATFAMQQDSQLMAISQSAANPKMSGSVVEKIGAFQKVNLAATIDFAAQRNFWRTQEFSTRAAIATTTVKPPRIGPPPPPPPPCGTGGGCRLKFDPKIFEILVAINASDPVKLTFMDAAGKLVDVKVSQTSVGAGLQKLSFDLSTMPNLKAGTISINAFDRTASVGFDVAQF